MDSKMFVYLDSLHDNNDFNGIIQFINNIPRNQWNYDLINHLARAYNNADFFDEALKLLDSCKEAGINDHLWHFRKAYAHYYKEENELARTSFEEALRLRPGDDDTLLFLNALNKEESSDNASFPEGSSFVVAQLNARLQPLDRGEIFEDPLNEKLEEGEIGSVCGGGTLLAKGGEVEYCDIEINLREINGKSIKAVIESLEQLGAPKGSKLRISSDEEIPFGVTEGLAIYLNGSDLPDEVYRDCDSNIVYNEISRLIDGKGMVMSYWQGPSETALYLYGESFHIMKFLIDDFVSTYPLCQKCRIVQIA